MRPKVYIDGQAGTTALRIREWLAGRSDIELVTLPDALRKDDSARREAISNADLAILCLPDDAARVAGRWAQEAGTRVLDASTAHRVAEGWVYGMPELTKDARERIRRADRVANPGCYPTGFVLLVAPLVRAGLLDAKAPLTCHALSGYTGGGRAKIERWEAPERALLSLPFEAPNSTERVHKHVPEMVTYAGLAHEPYFVPAVGPFRTGMRVQIPLHAELLRGVTARQIGEALQAAYTGERFVRVFAAPEPVELDERSLDPRACNDTNRIALHVLPHPSGHVLLVAILDNLGKGASGAAIQNMNLMLGFPEDLGLV